MRLRTLPPHCLGAHSSGLSQNDVSFGFGVKVRATYIASEIDGLQGLHDHDV